MENEIVLKDRKEKSITNSNPNKNNIQPDIDLLSKYILNEPKLSILSIIHYLEYDDLINLRMCSKTLKKTINKKIVKKYVRSGGISNKTRKQFWLANLDYSRYIYFITK